jgi:class 3 adenylate cyclase/tetratricopeptide (TPR) repeat protein
LREASPVSYTPKHLAEKILTSKGAIEGERKTVTVMFADVSGFTAMSERLDPEDVHGIMDRAFEVILGAVHHHEGTVNQFLGDGAMALFGAPIAHEDHAQRALSAAWAILQDLRPLAADIKRVHGIEFRMRMGVNTGPVVVGMIGRDLRMDYTALGDTVNLAARLLTIAQPGQIVVSRRTQRLRDRSFAFEDLGEFQVKGKSEPVRAYALIGEVRGRTRLEVPKERSLTPLAGRDAELALLSDAFDRALAGAGTAVLLSGEPGSGKSRLLYEFLHQIDTAQLLELETTCASYGRSTPYRPILELLRSYLDLPQDALPDDVRDRIAERLQDLEIDDAERLTLVAHFVGAPAPAELLNRFSAAQLKARTFEALCAVFLGSSRLAPLLLLTENVHWMDESSAEFLSYLADRLDGHRVLLLMSARPGLPQALGGLRAERVTVPSLGPDDVAGMARTLLGATSVAPGLLELLSEKGEGNPLYVEEVLLQLKETGGVIVEHGEARLGGADVKVPATIHDIIAARVDRLDERPKLTLQGAAVVGRRFGISLVGRVIDVAGTEVSRHLSSLHNLDFVFPAAIDPELMYSFKHALTQDVVYMGLLERRRRLYHAAAGHGLEELYRERLDEVVELLAYHFGASSEDEKAVDYALRAAEKAQHRWAHTEALAFFESALKRLGSMADTPENRLRRIDAVVKQAEIKFALGRHAEHIQALESIRDLVQAAGDARRRASWHFWTGFIHSLTGAAPSVSLAHSREAVAIADAERFDDVRAHAECCLAHVYLTAGELREAVAAGERALGFFESTGNVWWSCRTLWALVAGTMALGEWTPSLDYGRRALEHGRAVNDLRLKVVALWRLGQTHILRGDVDEGLRCCEEALVLSPAPFDAAVTTAVKGYGLVRAGQTAAGVAALTEALAWLDRLHLGHFRLLFAPYLAEGYLREGERARARELIEETLDGSRGVSPRFEALSQRLFGELLIAEDLAAAAGHLDAAARTFEELGARNEFARALATRGELLRASGDVLGARATMTRALAIFEELGTLDEPSRVREALELLDSSTR